VRIALNLKAFPTLPRRESLRDGGDQWTQAYRRVNPQSRVPTLVHDGNVSRSRWPSSNISTKCFRIIA
jgi:glutathione S-transferase